MKKGVKNLIFILAAAILCLCGFCYSNSVSAEGEGTSSYYLLLDETKKDSLPGETYYKANKAAGITSGYTSQAVGREITISTVPNQNFKVWGWVVQTLDESNEFILTSNTNIEVNYKDKNGIDQHDNIVFTLTEEKTIINLSKLWTDLKIEPIFEKVKFSIEVGDLYQLSNLTQYTDDIYYQSSEAEGGYSVFKNAFYFTNSKWYFVDNIYKKDGNLFIKEQTLEDVVRERYVPLTANAYSYDSLVEVVGSITDKFYVEINQVKVNNTVVSLNQINTAEIVEGKGIYKATDYNIAVGVKQDLVINIESRKMFEVALNIQHDGIDLTNDYGFKDEIKVGSGVTIPTTWHEIGDGLYIVYENETYILRAKNIDKVVDGVNYKYFTAFIDGVKTTLKQVRPNSDQEHTVNFVSVEYQINYQAVLFKAGADPTKPDVGSIVELSGLDLPIEPNRIVRGNQVELNTDTMSGKTNVGYRFVGYILERANLDKNNAEKNSILPIELDSETPKNQTVYVCFEYVEYKIKLNAGPDRLNNKTNETDNFIYSINQAYVQKSKVQAGYDILDNSQPYLLTFDMSFKLGDKIKFLITPNLGFTLKGISIKNPTADGFSSSDYIIDELELTTEILRLSESNIITIFADCDVIEYEIELTASNYEMSQLIVDQDITGEIVMDATEQYIEKITYTGLNLYQTVQLKSSCLNDSMYHFVGYYVGNQKIGSLNPFEFKLTPENLTLFDDSNKFEVVVRYQANILCLTITDNKSISYSVTVEQNGSSVSKDHDVYSIEAGDVTVSLSNIQFGYYLHSFTFTENQFGETTIGKEQNGNQLIVKGITGNTFRELTLNFKPITYNVIVKNLGEETSSFNKTVDVENLDITVDRWDNRHYVQSVVALSSEGAPDYTGILKYKEKEIEYLAQLNNLKNQQEVGSVTKVENNPIVISFENALELENFVKYYLVDGKIVLGVNYSIAKYLVAVELVSDTYVYQKPAVVVTYSFGGDYISVEEKDRSYDNINNTIYFKVPIETNVRISADYPQGVEFDCFEENEQRYDVADNYSIASISDDHQVKLRYKLVGYLVQIAYNLPNGSSNPTGIRPSVTQYGLMVDKVNIFDDFTIDSNNFYFKNIGVSVSSIYYFKEYDGELDTPIYTREEDENALGGYTYRLYQDELEDDKYYVLVSLTILDGKAKITEFDPSKYVVDNNGLVFFVDYQFISISFDIRTNQNSYLLEVGVDEDFAEYFINDDYINPRTYISDININSGILVISPKLKTVELPIINGNEDLKIWVDLNKGVQVVPRLFVAGKEYFVNGNTLEIDVKDLFNEGHISSNGGTIVVTFDYEVVEKKATLTTQVRDSNGFYEKFKMMIDNVAVQNNDPKSLNYLNRFKVSCAWVSAGGFNTMFKVSKIVIYSGGVKYATDAKNVGVSSLIVSSETEIHVLLIDDIKIEFQIEALVYVNNAEITGGMKITRDFTYNIATTAGSIGEAVPQTDIPEIKVASTMKDYIKLTFDRTPIYAGEYDISIKFETTNIDYKWLEDIVIPHTVKFEIKKLILKVEAKLSAIGNIKLTYDGTTDFLIENYENIINNLYFSKGGANWLENNFDLNLRLINLFATRSDKTVGEKTLIISGFELALLADGSNKDIIDSIEFSADSLDLQNVLTVERKVIRIYNYDVYDKVFDGTDVAYPKDTSGVTVTGIVEGDDVTFDATKLTPKFLSTDISISQKDKIVAVGLGDSLSGEDAGNYAYEIFNINDKTIYPKTVQLELENGKVIKVENRSFETNRENANLIPIGSRLYVTLIYSGDANYIKHYQAIDKQLSSRTVFNEGYMIHINGKELDKNLTLLISNVKGKTIYAGVDTDSTRLNGKTEDGYWVIDVKDLPENTEFLFMVEDRNFLTWWQILLIVLGALMLIGGVIVIILVIRRKRHKDYSVNDKI